MKLNKPIPYIHPSHIKLVEHDIVQMVNHYHTRPSETFVNGVVFSPDTYSHMHLRLINDGTPELQIYTHKILEYISLVRIPTHNIRREELQKIIIKIITDMFPHITNITIIPR